MFCHHHDEADVYGSEPVPCPFCGLGGPDEAPETEDQPTTLAFDDSNEALRHALFDRDTGSGSSELTGYW